MESAIYLYSYQRHLIKTRDYTNYMEVIDLQKYKVYRKNPKVRMALAYRKEGKTVARSITDAALV